MIKVFKSKCINNFSYEKITFSAEKKYLAYTTDNKSIIVINGDQRKSFCNMDKCMFRHGHPYGFQKFFDVLDTYHVKNKKELKKLSNEL